MAGVTFDTGALIAIEQGDRRLQALLDEATATGAEPESSHRPGAGPAAKLASRASLDWPWPWSCRSTIHRHGPREPCAVTQEPPMSWMPPS